MQRELNFSGPSPILYLVATPIGNLSEWSPRAIETVKDADYVACEDTRHSGELLSRFNIDKQLISCHEHNEEQAGEYIVSLLKDGKKVCYMSDAGYPAISDPGSRLVKRCLENGIKVSTISGPNAALNALASSGLDSTHFYFHGFLPPKSNERKKELEQLSGKGETIIFYEAPHRIEATLKEVYSVLGNRQACLARELTKTHEEFIRGDLESLSKLDSSTLRGEMVLIVAGFTGGKEVSEEDIRLALKDALKGGLKGKEAVSEVCDRLDVKKNRVYEIYLKEFRS